MSALAKLWQIQIVLYYYFYMYRTLADPELLRRLPHRRLRFNNVGRNLHRPLFNIIFQGKTPANIVFTMYAGELAVMCFLSTPQIFSS